MPTWRPTARTDAFDVAVAVAVGALALASMAIGSDPEVVGPEYADYARPGGYLLVVGCIAPLLVRRRFPLTAAVVCTASLLLLRLIEVPEFTASALALFIVLYTAAAYGGRRRLPVLVGCGIGIGALLIWDIIRTADQVPEGKFVLLTVFSTAVNVFQLGAAVFLGVAVRSRRQREAVLEDQAVALRDAAESEARQAVLGERIRIARELHDVLAHHVSVMGVQAAAARRVLETQPAKVPELLATIESSSREAVVELQRLLGLLRQEGDVDDAGPQPTLEGLPALAEQLRDAGLEVSVDLDGIAADPVPPGVALSAYRIVQEALTNTLKHAGPGSRATVEVRRSPSSLEVIVHDDGRGAGTGDGTGHGLLGMRERVRLHGGELKVGRAASGGFEVRAWFPL